MRVDGSTGTSPAEEVREEAAPSVETEPAPPPEEGGEYGEAFDPSAPRLEHPPVDMSAALLQAEMSVGLPAGGTAEAAPAGEAGSSPGAGPGGVAASPNTTPTLRRGGVPGPEVEGFQHELNEWRARNGLPPIDEDGAFGPITEAAVREYQRASGLPDDGVGTPLTRERLALENDPDFQALDPDTQRQALDTLDRYPENQAARDNLRDLVKDPRFAGLPRADQERTLQAFEQHPGDAAYVGELRDLVGDPNFQGLDEGARTAVLDQMGRLDPAARADLAGLATDPNFRGIPADAQTRILTALDSAPAADRPALTTAYRQLIADSSFQALSADTQLAIAAQASNYPNTRAIDNLRRMAGASWLGGMSLADQQRSAQMVAFSSTHAHNATNTQQRDSIQNSLDQFLPPGGQLQLAWRNYADPPGQVTFGSADAGVLTLARSPSGLALGGNGPVPTQAWRPGQPLENKLLVDTMVHEVNHLMTGHTPAGTAERFQDEYRAWYVGFQADQGRPPTRQEAWGRIQNQLNLPAYAHLAQATRETDQSFWQWLSGSPGTPTADAQAIMRFAGQFYPPGSRPSPTDPASANTIINGGSHTPPNPNDPAPLPDPPGNMTNRGTPGSLPPGP